MTDNEAVCFICYRPESRCWCLNDDVLNPNGVTTNGKLDAGDLTSFGEPGEVTKGRGQSSTEDRYEEDRDLEEGDDYGQGNEDEKRVKAYKRSLASNALPLPPTMSLILTANRREQRARKGRN